MNTSTTVSTSFLTASKPFEQLKGVGPVESQFVIQSIHGSNSITKKCLLPMFGQKATFFILDNLSTFDGIIGLDLLKQVDAAISLKKGTLVAGGVQEKIHYHNCRDVNHSKILDIEVPIAVKPQFLQMLKDCANAFADPNESLPFNTAVVATIRTVSDQVVHSKLYPYPRGVDDFVASEVNDLLKNGIIRKSSSPYNNPVWMVDKKGIDSDGNRKKRLVIDFRKLNKNTIADKYPMPSITMILANLGKAKFFTTLDLKSGYHQITLAEQDREKTAFSVSGGKYEFCRLPFGLKNAGSILQRAIDDVLREQIGKSCYVYVDDVIIFSESEKEHVKHVEWVLKSLRDANMRVAQEKSQFFRNSVEYLGFIVTNNGAKTDPEKVKAIQQYAEPDSLFAIRSFLGLASYYRCFIKDLASIAKPLFDILKGENGSVSKYRSKKIPVIP